MGSVIYYFYFFSRLVSIINFWQNLIEHLQNLIVVYYLFIIFMNNLPKQQLMTFQGEASHGMPTNEDEYISQFLVFESDQKVEKQHNQKDCVEALQPLEQLDQPDQIYQESSSPIDYSSSVSQKAKRSPLHNFQKHFVTTIRRGVRLRWPEQLPNYLQLAKQMWQIFKSSKKYTKEFVSLILGQSESQIDEELLKKYELNRSVSRYTENDYLKAQAYLKNKVLQTFKTIPKQKIMYQRRIGKKEQFASYFFKVLSEIEEGVMNKRLPKKKRGGRRNSYLKLAKQNINPKFTKTQENIKK